MRELNYLDYVAPRFAQEDPDSFKVIYISGRMYQFKGLDGRYNPHPFSYCPVADFMNPEYVQAVLVEIKEQEEWRQRRMKRGHYKKFADYKRESEKGNLNTIEILVVMDEPDKLFYFLGEKKAQDLYRKIVAQALKVGIHVVEIRQKDGGLERKYVTERVQKDQALLQGGRGHLEPENQQKEVHVKMEYQINQLQIKKTEVINLPLVEDFTELSKVKERRLIQLDQNRWGHREYMKSEAAILEEFHMEPLSLAELDELMKRKK